MTVTSRVRSRSQSPRSLPASMLSVFTLVMVVVTGILALMVDHMIRRTTLQERGEQSVVDASAFANLIDADIAHELASLKARAENMYNLGLTDTPVALERSLANLDWAMPDYAWLGYANLEGRVVAATDGMPSASDKPCLSRLA